MANEAKMNKFIKRIVLEKEQSREYRKVERIVNGLANHLAREYKNELWKAIKNRGGIRSYKNGKEYEEYKANVPLGLKRRKGLPPDEMASLLGLEGDQELYRVLKEYNRIDYRAEAMKILEDTGLWNRLNKIDRLLEGL